MIILKRQVTCCEIKDNGLYRYLLEVQLAVQPENQAHLVVILKNPSKADTQRSDATCGKVEAWATRRNFSRVTFVNLFAFRSTTPATLNQCSYAEAVGPENNYYIKKVIAEATTVVGAWGNSNGINQINYDRRIAEVVGLVGANRLMIVGSLTKKGYPRHGRDWNYSPELLSYPA
jgi:hypothetical protein